MKILNLEEIKSVLPNIDLISIIEEGFIELSNGNIVNPPVGELLFDNPPGDAHIKYGYLKNSDFYVIKIAAGFYKNHLLNLPTTHGLMIVFNKKTGQIESILLDEGYLTNIRTAIAGAIAAKYLAPKNIKTIGIVGTGIQARMQLYYLKNVVACKNVIVYGLRNENLQSYKDELQKVGFNIVTTKNVEEMTKVANLIITTTPATLPILDINMLQPGTHITAIGSDTPEKNEIHPNVLQAANLIVTDSREQAKSRGEIFQAIKSNAVSKNKQIVEIGEIINGTHLGRKDDSQLTLADFTGVAAQDIKIAEAIHLNHSLLVDTAS